MQLWCNKEIYSYMNQQKCIAIHSFETNKILTPDFSFVYGQFTLPVLSVLTLKHPCKPSLSFVPHF